MVESPTNIWGRLGCELPNGELCDACCHLLGIQASHPFLVEMEFIKPIGEPCEFQKRCQGKGAGCGIYEFRPGPCQNFHCSQAPELSRRLIFTALNDGLVTKGDAVAAWKKHGENLHVINGLLESYENHA